MTLQLGGGGAITGCTSLQEPALTLSGLTVSGPLDVEKIIVSSGTAAAPTYTFSGDTDNGLYYAGTNSIGLATNGTNAILIDSSGKVGIGTSSPAQLLTLSSAGPRILLTQTSANSNAFLDAATSGVLEFSADDNNVAGSSSMRFKVDGSERLRIDSSGRLLVGTSSATGSYLLQVNSDATINSLTIGRGAGDVLSNTAIGNQALLSNTTGTNNTAIGNQALLSNTTGTQNTANGNEALYSNTTGIQNTANGFNALYSNTTGNYNTANGTGALRFNTTGANNTANGYQALYLTTTGSNNTANGFQALYSNTTGYYNVANGYQALVNNTTGSGNIGIGFRNNAGTYAPVFDPTTENNRLVLGHTAITNAYVKVAWTVTSDERDKMNFAPVPYGLDFVNQLKPTAYQFKVDRDTETPNGDVRYGFKAQDILALEGDNPVIIDTEDAENLKYKGEHLVPVLVNAVQELTTMVNELKSELAALKGA